MFLCLAAYGQTKEEAIIKLQRDIIRTNAQLPAQVGGLTVAMMEIDGGDFFVYCTVDENQMDIDECVANLNANKSQFWTFILEDSDETALTFIQSELNIRIVVIGEQTERIEEVILTAGEILEQNNSLFNAYDFMPSLVETMREDLPEYWGDGLTLTSVFIDNNYLCFIVRTDESVITLPLLRIMKAEGQSMEQSILEEFTNVNDPNEKLFLTYLRQSGMGIKYVYIDLQFTDAIIFTLTPDMIRDAM